MSRDEAIARGHAPRYRAAICSVAGCKVPPIEEFLLPEGYLAVACDEHRRDVEAWTKAPLGAPRGARLIGFHQLAPPPPGAKAVEVATGDTVASHTGYGLKWSER